MDLTVLGSAGSHTGAGLACSGYLLRSGDAKVMLDCGNGSTSNLQRILPFWDLDGVVISHRHIDHCADLIGMYYALKFHPEGSKSIDLYLAPQVLDMLDGILSQDSAMEFREVFHSTVVEGGDEFQIGPFSFQTYPSVHPVPTLSLRVTDGVSTLAYSSDSAGGPDLVECARDVDLFLCEATWNDELEDLPEGIHLTGREAGRIAAEAGARQLLLTHLLPTLDRSRTLREAQEAFGPGVDLAEDNRTWTLW